MTGGSLSKFFWLQLDDGHWSFLDGGGWLADHLQCHRSDCMAAGTSLKVMSRFLGRSCGRHSDNIQMLNGVVRRDLILC